MSRKITVVVDADAIIAQAHSRDLNHNKAMSEVGILDDLGAKALYPVTAITEAVTTLQRKLNSTATAYGVAMTFANKEVEIVEVDHEIYSNAVNKYFSPSTSKKNTLFDCIVASTADKYKADAVFSFDKFYKSKGFKLVSDLH